MAQPTPPPWIQELQQRDPKFVESYLSQREHVLKDGAIPGKYKILMTMVIDALLSHPDGVATIANRARAAGASETEIQEAVEVAYLFGGTPALVTAVCKERWFLVLALCLVVGGVLTGLTNGMPVMVRHFHPPIAGIHLTDGLYSAAVFTCLISIPFYIGWALFRKESDFRAMLVALVIAALIYAPFAAFEMRMSPNLHLWVYGYSQHDFSQTVREGGYRPMVFMTHGLSLARFFFVGTCSAFILGRVGTKIFGMQAKWLGWFLLLVLIFCRSFGAIMFAGLAVPLLLWSKPRLHVRIALILAVLVGLYPLLRTWELVPTEHILNTVRAIAGEDRTESLEFRFFNENLLLEKARQHLLFGWGQYGRNFAPRGWDGQAVADGYWVIQIGIMGLVGFITTFGPMLIPLIFMQSRLKAVVSEPQRVLLGGVALMLGLVALDWVPNGLFSPYPYMMVGALAGATREFPEAPPEAVAVAWVPAA